MTTENIIAFAAVIVTLIGGFTALFTALFGASKVSFNQLKKAFDELKKTNDELRTDNMTLKNDNNTLRCENANLVKKVSALEAQVRNLKKALAQALKTIEKFNYSKGEQT
jgi:archaellum component FlaC